MRYDQALEQVLRPGSADHFAMCGLRLRGYLPRLGRGKLRPWPEIMRALHAADDACIYLIKNRGVTRKVNAEAWLARCHNHNRHTPTGR